MHMGKETAADVLVISETWLNNSVLDNAINIEEYNVFRTDRLKRGGGLVIYIKNRYEVTLLLSKSISKQFELLAVGLFKDSGLYCSRLL